MSIYVPPDSNPQIRRLYFRNLSATEIVVKLVSSKPQVVEFARSKIRLEPESYLFIETKFTYSNLGTFDIAPPQISGYARPVYAHNLAEITKWLNTPGAEINGQLAFRMQVYFSTAVFSARDIIVDLPGTACLVEPVSKSIPLQDHETPVQNADADTRTAVTFTMIKDVVSDVRDTNESSWLRDLISVATNRSSAAPSNEAVKTDATAMITAIPPTSSVLVDALTNGNNFVNVEQEATPCGGD